MQRIARLKGFYQSSGTTDVGMQLLKRLEYVSLWAMVITMNVAIRTFCAGDDDVYDMVKCKAKKDASMNYK